jgi:hypothetical protein
MGAIASSFVSPTQSGMSRLEPRSAPFRRNTSHLVKAVLLRGSSAFRPGHFSLHCPGGLEGQEPTGTEPTGTELTGTRNQPAGDFVGNGNQRRLGLLKQREPTGKWNQQANGTKRQRGTNRQGEPTGKGNRAGAPALRLFPRHIEAGRSAHTQGDQLDLKP